MIIQLSNPANPSHVIGTYETLSSDELPDIMAEAREAQRTWAALPQPQRGRIVGAFLDALEARKEDIARSITLEMGKTIAEARGEVTKALSEGRFAVSRAGMMMGQTLPSQKLGVMVHTVRRPRGVIVGITPWNFPFGTPIRKTIPALVFGNAMVLKPSINTPGAAVIMAEAAKGILPDDLFRVVIGTGDFSSALTACSEIDAISFTGSVGVGKKVAMAAAANLAEVSLELGGKNPAILHDAHELDSALDQIYAAAFAICGQRCTAISRVLVKRDLAKAAIDGLSSRARAAKLGDGLEDGITMGPLSSDQQLSDVSGFVERAIKEGATLSAGGEALRLNTGGYFYRPTILSKVTPDMEVARQEVFGPVLSVIEYDDIDDAMHIANDVAYGLTSCLFSEQSPVIEQFIARSESGMLHVNHGSFPDDHVPFVGLKASSLGVGGSNGDSTVQFFTSEHAVYRKARA